MCVFFFYATGMVASSRGSRSDGIHFQSRIPGKFILLATVAVTLFALRDRSVRQEYVGGVSRQTFFFFFLR